MADFRAQDGTEFHYEDIGSGHPVILIHGDADTVVPLEENSATLLRHYQEEGEGSLVRLDVLPGQGHNYFEGFFHSQALVDFAILHARLGARP